MSSTFPISNGMEDLNKNQIVLLTLLVSFVTSIATGIMTVSLLQVAPVEVTRNINSIVEKTIEKVTPSNNLTLQKEVTTIVVKEEDSITEAISKNVKSIVRIKEWDPLADITNFYGLGLVIDKNGSIVADRKTITEGNKYTAVASDGSDFSLTATGTDKKTNFIIFKPSETISTSTRSALVVGTFGTSDPKLGQTVISLGGNTTNAVSVGRVTLLGTSDETVGTTTTKYISGISTDVSIKDLVDGSPLFNLSGEIIGIKLSDDISKSFTAISILKKELDLLK